MQCFVHSNETAVGLCKSCGKGVCRSCAIQIDRGLACSEQCKPIAEALSRLQLVSIRNIGLYTAQRVVQPMAAVVLIGAALFFFANYGADPSAWFLLALGAVLAFASVMARLRRSRS